jgi:O-antigen/teichoic acid export membrane protein
MEKKEKYSLTEQASYLMYGKLFAFSLRIFIPIILVRILSQDNYGLYRQILLVALTFDSLLRFGIPNSLFYFFPTAEQKEEKRQLLSQSFYLLLFIGFLFLPIFYLLRKPISNYFQHDLLINFIYPLGLFIFFFLASAILEFIFILEKKSKVVFGYLIVNQIVRQVLVLVGAWAFRSLVAVIWLLVAFSFLRMAILYFYLKKNYNLKLTGWDRDYFSSQIQYSVPLGMGGIIATIRRSFDDIILSKFLTPGNYGIYSIGKFRLQFVDLIYESVGNVVLPKISLYRKQGAHHKSRELWHEMVIKFSVVTLPLVVFFLVLAEPLFVFLFTEDYLSSVLIFRIFLIMLLAQMLHHGTILRMYNETKFIFKANLISSAIGILLGYFLIRNYGMIGGAIASVLTFHLNCYLQLHRTKLILDLNFSELLPWKSIGTVMLFSLLPAPLLFLAFGFHLNDILTLAAGALFYFPIVLILFLKFNYLDLKKILLFLKK